MTGPPQPEPSADPTDRPSFDSSATHFPSAQAYTDYGAPRAVFVSVDVTGGGGHFAASVLLMNKTATRLPEAAFVTFNPGADGAWSNSVLGVTSNATAVVSHGSQHLHGSDAVSWRGATGGASLAVRSVDAGLLCYGEPTAFPTTAGTAAGRCAPMLQAPPPSSPPHSKRSAALSSWAWELSFRHVMQL